MKSPVIVCCIVLSASSCALAAPAGRIGEAEVRQGGGGAPCFTISEREERRGGTPDFDAVTVFDAGRRAVLWKMAMPRSRTFPVTFSMCIPYAGRVPALPQTPAAGLEAGRVYQVRIDARTVRGSSAPQAYDARFCLARQRDGSTVVHNIGRDEREGRHLYGCVVPAN